MVKKDKAPMSQEWKRQIEMEYRKLKSSEETMHNTLLHNSILEAWKRDSPQMYARLEKAGMVERVAFVMQQRMWQMQEDLMRAGFPVTDAWEQAERETLMLEPEESAEESAHPEWPMTPPMAKSSQKQ